MMATERIKEIVREKAEKTAKIRHERRPVDVIFNAYMGDPRVLIAAIMQYLDEKEFRRE